MSIVFPWSHNASCTSQPFLALPLIASSPVHLQLLPTSSPSQNQNPHNLGSKSLELQLRQQYVVVVDAQSEDPIDFFECNLTLYFSIRQVKEFQKQPRQVGMEKPKAASLLQFSSSDYPQQVVAFTVQPQNQKSIEFFRKCLERCEIIQRDFHEHFKPVRKIGKGANASVFAAVRLRDSIVVAIKAFSKSCYFGKEDGKGKEAFRKELKILVQSKHKNLCQFQGLYETENTIYIVMKNYQKTLSSVVLTSKALPREWIVEVMEQLLQGVATLHANGIMHRDLKLENIMVNQSQQETEATIIDMGMSEYFNQKTYLFEQCGTPGYVSPDIFGPRPPHPQKCDIFSLGVVFYILLFKKHVFEGSPKEIIANSRAGRLNIDMYLLNQEEWRIKDLLLKMLMVKNQERITAQQALEHCLFRSESSLMTPSLSMSVSEVTQAARVLDFDQI